MGGNGQFTRLRNWLKVISARGARVPGRHRLFAGCSHVESSFGATYIHLRPEPQERMFAPNGCRSAAQHRSACDKTNIIGPRTCVGGGVPCVCGLPQPAACAADTTPTTGAMVINNNRSAANRPGVTLAPTRAHNAGGSDVSRFPRLQRPPHFGLPHPQQPKHHALPRLRISCGADSATRLTLTTF